jgi:5'-nucleotidase
VPAIKKVKGALLTMQGKSTWDDTYEIRLDPAKRQYFWLTGSMKKMDKTNDFDVKAVDEGYISVTPIHYDLTDYKFYQEMKNWKL